MPFRYQATVGHPDSREFTFEVLAADPYEAMARAHEMAKPNFAPEQLQGLSIKVTAIKSAEERAAI